MVMPCWYIVYCNIIQYTCFICGSKVGNDFYCWCKNLQLLYLWIYFIWNSFYEMNIISIESRLNTHYLIDDPAFPCIRRYVQYQIHASIPQNCYRANLSLSLMTTTPLNFIFTVQIFWLVPLPIPNTKTCVCKHLKHIKPLWYCTNVPKSTTMAHPTRLLALAVFTVAATSLLLPRKYLR